MDLALFSTWGDTIRSHAYVIENIMMLIPYGFLLSLLTAVCPAGSVQPCPSAVSLEGTGAFIDLLCFLCQACSECLLRKFFSCRQCFMGVVLPGLPLVGWLV